MSVLGWPNTGVQLLRQEAKERTLSIAARQDERGRDWDANERFKHNLYQQNENQKQGYCYPHKSHYTRKTLVLTFVYISVSLGLVELLVTSIIHYLLDSTQTAMTPYSQL